MESHIIGIKARNLNRKHFGGQGILHPAPNVELAILILRGEREGFHHGMVQEWHLIFGFDRLCAQCCLHIALTRFAVGLTLGDDRVMRLENRCGRHTGMATVAKAGCQSAQTGNSRPIALGDNGHGIIELDDLLHALNCQGRCGVDGTQLAATHGRRLNGGDAHGGDRKIHAILRAAVDLGRNIEPLHRLPNQAILRGIFQLGFVVQ